MNGRTLLAEYLAAVRATTAADLQPLFDAGITATTIATVVPAIARIAVHGSTYTPDPDGGGLAYILAVRHDNPVTPEAIDPAEAISSGDVVDLLAFHPRHPGRWVLRYGSATWLGSTRPQYLDPEPVRIWRSPIAWLRAGCDGLVLLTHDRRDQYRTLSCLHNIVAEDREHAAALRRVLQYPFRTPEIIVPEARYAA